MNKAFVREPDSQDDYCPRCGTIGQAVNRSTIRNFATENLANSLATQASFCTKPTCEVAYFDVFERTILAADLVRPVYPKSPKAPICECFGLTEEDIDRDIVEGGKTRTRSAVERARSKEAHCDQCAANGRSCVAEIQRYYLSALKLGKKS